MWTKLSITARCHFIGQVLAIFVQTVLPDLGLSDHIYHLIAILLAYAQSVVGLWSLFVQYGDKAIDMVSNQPKVKPPDK